MKEKTKESLENLAIFFIGLSLTIAGVYLFTINAILGFILLFVKEDISKLLQRIYYFFKMKKQLQNQFKNIINLGGNNEE